MSLVLVIDTSARPFNVVLGQHRECLFDSFTEPGMPDEQDLSVIVTEAFRKGSQSIKDIRAIAVNIGPGALGSVRSGVSFANALAYSLGVPVYPITSFELMGFVASKNHRCPVLCTARASNGYAYVGVYKEGRLSFMCFGFLAKLAPEAIDGIERVAVAGNHRPTLCNMLRSGQAIDSGLERSVAATFLHLDYSFDRNAKVFPAVANPITEESEELCEPATVCR